MAELPDTKMKEKELPVTEQSTKDTPSPEQKKKPKPDTKQKKRELPAVGIPENTVRIGDQLIEIKTTKVKYQRNRTALFYKVLDNYSLVDVLGYDVGVFDPERDGDKCVMDWLIAATDNEQLIVDNYDDMDTETIERILDIFKRVNKIDEKDEKRKNLEAAMRQVSQ